MNASMIVLLSTVATSSSGPVEALAMPSKAAIGIMLVLCMTFIGGLLIARHR